MKKNLLLFLTAVSTAFAFFYVTIIKKNGKPQGAENVLIVGTNASFPPFQYMINGNLEGFDIDLMNLIGKQLNKTIEFKDMAFDSLLVEAQTGRIHVIAAGMTPTQERGKKVLFTKPYVTGDALTVITMKPYAPQTLADLKGKEVIVNEGYTAETFMEKQEGVTLKRLETPAEAFLALTSNRGHAYVSARSAAQSFFNKHGIEKFNLLTLPESESAAFAVSKHYPELHENIEKILNELETSGELKKLKQKWHLDF